ncbi:PREDICTED: probable cytochrome P450 6a13 [Cyphomyrmex costatus]|nr:PREDICTED: probable cytochrome P450 6a13 [Cyphomyrmex costatus]XP_018406376.1 PREDICTED: probable cytochrome P450 6a13 [Cyphomyrmex costatus]XP_018406378.1 PREDICTED: probable cytochrome P450 6a13 [Cyphomyrmex costatus]
MREILEILSGVIVLVFAFYYYYKLKFDFWKKHGIPGPKPTIYFGTAKDIILQKKLPVQYYKEIYDEYKHASLVGLFIKTIPILIIKDPALIKDVLITDGMIFTGRGVSYSKKAEPLMDTLFYAKGEEALHLRAKLSPLFTPSKLKIMLSLLIQRSEAFKNWLDNSLLLKNKYINCSELTGKLTADYSGVCLLNYDVKTFRDKKIEIFKYVKKFNKGDSWKCIFKRLLPDKVIYNKLYDLISYYLFDAELMQFCIRFAMDIVNDRRKHNISKYDVVNILKEFKNGKSTEKAEMLDQHFVTQVFMFFLAAFDTSAVTMSNTLYELALNHTIQNRLREEINNIYIKNNGEITFDDINMMFYLDAVSKETMRKYPLVDLLTRQASSAYTFKNSQLTIPKGQIVGIPVHAIHFDPDIYPKPEIYDPERFIGDAAARSKQSMHYMPFGYGPRNCIGERFGMLQLKMGLITFLRNYKFNICEKTPKRLKYISAILVQQPSDIYLKVTKIE